MKKRFLPLETPADESSILKKTKGKKGPSGKKDEFLVDDKILEALMEKLFVDAANSPYGRVDGFDFSSLHGLSLEEAFLRYPKLLEIMDDVIIRVNKVVSNAMEYAVHEKESAEHGRKNALLLKRFGNLFLRNGHLPQALKAFEGALHFLADEGEIYTLMGDVYVMMGDLEKALFCYGEARQSLEDDFVVSRKLADVHVKFAEGFFGSDNGKAVQCYEQALQCIDGYPPAMSGLGEIALLEGDCDTALENFEKVLDRDPSNVRALVGFANAHSMSGNLDEADALFREAITLNQFYLPGLYNYASFHFYSTKNFVQARVYIDRAAGLDPRNVEILLLKVEIAMAMKDFDSAEKAVEEVLVLDPGNKEAFSFFCRLKNGECFLPENYMSSFQAVKVERQASSRDLFYSLKNFQRLNNARTFDRYVNEVSRDQQDRFSRFRSKYDGPTFLN